MLDNIENILVLKNFLVQDTFKLDPPVDIEAEVQGFEIADPDSFGDDEKSQLYAAYLQSLVPPIDPDYQFRFDETRDLCYWWSNGSQDVLYLWGPTGSGKTSLIEQWCARLGVPIFCGKGHKGFEPHEAFGHYVAGPNGETIWAPGPVTLAAQYGLPVVINEYDRIQASRAIVFNDVFEGRPFPIPGKHGEVVIPQPGFRCVVTGNTNMVEDVTGNYSTFAVADTSLLERFYSIRVGYPSPECEEKLVASVLSNIDDDYITYWLGEENPTIKTANGMMAGAAIPRDELVKAFVRFANTVRKQSKDGGDSSDSALERTVSTRVLRKIAFHAIANVTVSSRGKSSLHHVVSKFLTDMSSESTRIAIHLAVEQEFAVKQKV